MKKKKFKKIKVKSNKQNQELGQTKNSAKLVLFVFGIGPIIGITIFLYSKGFSDVNTDKIINYLSSFKTLKSNFIQVNSNGDILTGKVLLVRPGKFRVEYNEISVLIISDGRKVAVINKDIKNISFYGLKDLPASIILFKDISLDNIYLLKSKDLENRIEIPFSTNKKRYDEKIHITFEKQPLIMKKWATRMLL